MTDRRSSRLNEQFKREISEIITRKVRDHRIGLLWVTEVRVTKDLWLARVFIRPQGSESEMAETSPLVMRSSTTIVLASGSLPSSPLP